MTEKSKSANKPEVSTSAAQHRRVMSSNVVRPEELKLVQVGSVSVWVRTPTAGELKKRVNESKTVVVGLSKAVMTPGVKLSVKSTTPMYSADATNPNLVVRKVGNKVSRGMFKKGVFVKVA